MPIYRYHLYDPATGTLVDTLPLENVSASWALRGVGTFSGDLPLYADGLDPASITAATRPDRMKLFMERDSSLIWGGRVIQPRAYDSSTRRLTISAEETVGALDFRFVPSLTYAATDQVDIARGVVAALQAQPYGNLGLQVDAVSTSGVLRDQAWTGADQTSALSAITDLSQLPSGFEWATQVAWGPGGVPTETLQFGYPRLGRVGSSSGLGVEYIDDGRSQGGNAASYTFQEGTGFFTRAWASAQTGDGTALLASADNTTLLAAGYPLLEETQAYDGVTSLPVLQQHAAAMAAYAATHQITAVFTVSGGKGLDVGSWQMGDDVLTRISDFRFPPNPQSGAPGYVGYLRINATTLTPAGGGTPEQYAFTLSDQIDPV